jgi:hypothetical protein
MILEYVLIGVHIILFKFKTLVMELYIIVNGEKLYIDDYVETYQNEVNEE